MMQTSLATYLPGQVARLVCKFSNPSDAWLLAAYGGSHVFCAAAWQPQAAMPQHKKRLRTAVECRFIEHGRPPIYRVDTAGGRSPEELPDYQIYYLTSFKLRCYTMKKHSCNLSTIWWRPSLHWAFFLRRTPLSCLWRIT